MSRKKKKFMWDTILYFQVLWTPQRPDCFSQNFLIIYVEQLWATYDERASLSTDVNFFIALYEQEDRCELCIKVGSLSNADCLVGFEVEIFWFEVEHFISSSYSFHKWHYDHQKCLKSIPILSILIQVCFL